MTSSILIATLPKSGTVYIRTSLADALNWPTLEIKTGRLNDSVLIPEAMEEFSRGRYVASAHLPPTWGNRYLLKHFGIDDIVVHVRDPRSAVLSWTHFLEQELAPKPVPSYRFRVKRYAANVFRRGWLRGSCAICELAFRELGRFISPKPVLFSKAAQIRAMLPVPDHYVEMPFNERLAWQIENYMPICVNWITQWCRRIDAANDFDPTVFLSTHEMLHHDADRLLRDILAFFNLRPKPKWQAGKPKRGEKHFRSGQLYEWRDVMSADLLAKANDFIPQHLFDRFQWPRY